MKIREISYLAEIIQRLKNGGKKIVQAHGCFDIPHIGHIRHLQKAKEQGDVLIVTITSDRYVNKGPNRPVFTAEQRAEALSALSCVDYVAINDSHDASDAIMKLEPDVYVKGSDYKNVRCDEFDTVTSIGAKIVFTDTEKFSSTALVDKL